MAVSVSRKLLRSFYGSLSALGRCDSSTITCRSFLTYHDLYGHLNGQNIFSSGSSCLSKGGSPILANRWLSTSILTSELGEGAFPSNLLSTKPVATAERTIGNTFNKTISAVSGTGRKPWRQRVLVEQGMEHCMDPRGGATMHGLKPRSHAFKLNRKVRRRLGLKIALTARAAEGKYLMSWRFQHIKTKNLVNCVKQMLNTKKLLLVDGGPIGEKLKLATQNLHYANVLPSIGLNVYSILLHDTLVVFREAVNKIVERMHTPINR